MQLQIEQIRTLLRQEDCPFLLRYQPETDSTNEWAKREARAGRDQCRTGRDRYSTGGVIFLADHQTAGKGRRGRAWESPGETSVAMSILLQPELPPDRLSMLTLVMGLSAAEAIRDVCGLDAGIKWPNDVVYDGKKLCGILTEYDAVTQSVIIGIGLNINMEAFPEELAGVALSLRMACGRVVSREQVTAAAINRFRNNYETFCAGGDLGALKQPYEALLVNLNREVRVLDPNGAYEGIARGISAQGELLVERTDTGEPVWVYAGEVSVRGIYGYV